MKFSLAAALAFVASAVAQTADFDPITAPASGATFAVGSTLTIAWTAPAKYSGKTIAISLIGGDSQNTQVPIKDIATGVSNDAEAYNWAVDASLGDKNVYGLVIKLESNPAVFQYSNPFKIAGSDKPASEKPTKAAEPTYEAPVYGDDGTATLTAHYGSKTVSVSQVYSAPGAHTTVVAVEKTLTVPCNTTEPATTFVPIVKTASVPCNGTATATGPAAPPVYTHPSNPPAQSNPVPPVYPSQPAAPPAAGTPTPVPVSGAARFGAPVAVVAGLVMAAFAL